MNIDGVQLSVTEGVSPVDLHDTWLQLFRCRTEAAKAAAAMWQQWKAVENNKSPEAVRLWAAYSALQSDYRVLSAWADLFHTAWVFATDGRECRFVTRIGAGKALASSVS